MTGPRVSRWEFLPGWAAYGPIVVQWIALGIRYGDLSLPTAANPTIPTGGLCGEAKSQVLDLVRGEARAWIAPYATMTTGDGDLARAAQAMAGAGFSFPIVVKPDIGCNGTGVRLVETEAGLPAILAAFPRGVGLVLQQRIEHEGEAGVFYVRYPHEASGRITSLTLKYAPSVTGDGAASLRQLIERDPRHGKLQHLYLRRLERRLAEIPAAGSVVRLVFAGNHCKGSIFKNGLHEVTPALTASVEAIARAIPGFHFGRIDLRYESLAALRRGEGFRIIEINGAGSEATHIWDPDTSLKEIYGAQLWHYRAAFEIAAALRRQGAKTSGLWPMYRDWQLQRRLMRSYPEND